MSFRKGQVLHLFILICFSFYVISPFCYVGKRLYAEDPSAFTGNSGGSRVCVVWELLMSGPFQKGNAENGRAGVHFLIKKAHAVLGQNSPEWTPAQESVIVFYEDNFFMEGCHACSLQTASQLPEDGSHFLSSGVSPPFASLS